MIEPNHLDIKHWTHNDGYPNFTDKREGKPPRWMNPVKIPPLTEIPKDYNKTISVVITNWRYNDWVEYAIRGIVWQNFPQDMYEIIVVDDNSGGNIFEIMEKVRSNYSSVNLSFYETHKNVTFNIALAFNIGCKRAKNDIVINSPADCYQRGEYMTILSRYHTLFAEKGTRTAVCPNIICKDPKSGVPHSTFRYDSRPATDVGLAARREDYHAIKGYDERMRGWGGNEPDITGRLGLSGTGIGFCPNLVIATALGPSLTNIILNGDIPHLNPRHSTKDDTTNWGVGQYNHKRSNENYNNKIHCPNEEWGELDTLEKIF